MSRGRPGLTENPSRVAIPWGWFLALALLLFLTQHSLTYVPPEMLDSAPEEYEGGNLRRQITITLLGLVGATFFFSARGWRFGWHGPLLLTTLLFAGWLALSIQWSAAPSTAIRRLVILTFFFMGAYGMVVKWRRDVLLAFVAVAAAFQMVAGVITEILHGSFAPLDPLYRFSGNLHPNGQGQLCGVLVLASLAALQSKIRFRFVFLFLTLMGCCFLVLTKSLTSIAGCLAGFAAYSFLCQSRQRRLRFVYLAVMVSLVIGLFFSAEGLSLNPVASVAGRDPDRMAELSGRLPLWAECIDYVFERPIIGYGFEGFWSNERNDDMRSVISWAPGTAHSAYIDLWLQLGMMGLFLHTALLFQIFRRAVALHSGTRAAEYAAAAGVAVQYFVFGATESTSLIRTSGTLFYSYCIFLMVAIIKSKMHSIHQLPDGRPVAS